MTSKVKVEIVLADRNWILEEFAHHIGNDHAAISFDVQIVDKPTETADLYYFLPYSIFKRIEGAICVALFTHIEEEHAEAKERFFAVAHQADFCVCMSDRYERRLRESGVGNVITILPGVDRNRFQPRLRIGVVGRAYHTGRKNEGMVARLSRLPFVDLVFTGAGWPSRSVHVDDAALNDFYNGLDYLLVPAKAEGGPMPLLESIAAGTPVIAPDVGFVEQFPHIPYENSSYESLERVVHSLHRRKLDFSDSIAGVTWEAFGGRHVNLFRKLVAESVAGVGTRGAGESPSLLRVLLVTHGSEPTAKGGPTQRVRYTAQLLSKTPVAAECGFGECEPALPPSCVHVFNSWPTCTALKTLNYYRARNYVTVFSPIMLNLSFLPEYRALSGCRSRVDVRSMLLEAGNALQSYARSRAHPLETVPAHFTGLYESCALADIIVALSDHERELLESLGVEKTKISVVRNCVDPFFIDCVLDPQSFRKAIGVDSFFLCVGRVESRKNLLAACEALYDTAVPLVIIGGIGDIEYRRTLEDLYGDRVIFIDRIEDRALLASAYASCSAFLQLSWSEGACLSTLEAHACGAEILICPLSGEQEYYTPDDVVFVRPFDLDDIRERALQILSGPRDPIARRRRREPGVRASINSYVEGTLNAYRLATAGRLMKPPSGGVYIDITSYAHALHNELTTTGATALERKLKEAVLSLESTIQYVVWSHLTNCFHVVPPALATEEQLKLYLRKGDWPEKRGFSYFKKSTEAWARMQGGDATMNQPPKNPEVQPLIDKLDTAKLFNQGGVYLLFQVVKTAIRSLPSVLQARVVNLIRRRRPDFDLYRSLPKDTQARPRVALAEQYADGSATAKTLNQAFLHHQPFERGAMLVSLGNAWMSNRRYLDCLVHAVQSADLDYRGIVYDLLPVTHSEYFPAASVQKFEEHLGLLCRVSRHLFTISNYSLDTLNSYLRMHGRSVKTAVVPMASTVAAVVPAREVKGLPERYVLYVSSINKRKNHEFLLRVWVELQDKCPRFFRDVHLVLVGKNTFKDIVLSSFKNVVHLADVDDANLAAIYRDCMFTVYPSRAEGFGLPVVESLEYGKPCIASDIASLSAVRHPSIVKIKADDFYGWAEAIQSLVSNDRIRQSLTEECEEFSVDYRWEDAAAIMLSRPCPTPTIRASINSGAPSHLTDRNVSEECGK